MLLDSHKLSETLKKKIPGLRLAYLFGSQTTDNVRPDSDLDLAILATVDMSDLTRYDLAQELASEFNIDVDLIDLKTASTVLKAQIVGTGQSIFCAGKYWFSLIYN